MSACLVAILPFRGFVLVAPYGIIATTGTGTLYINNTNGQVTSVASTSLETKLNTKG